MKILSIDTTGGACSVAVYDNNKIICEQFLNNKLTHSVHLMKLVDNCVELTGVEINDFDLFAAACGPGSFTGIRIGLCAVKGFCQIAGKPAAKVDTLEALAMNLPQVGTVVPIIDARREHVYTAVFKDGSRISEDMVIPIKELLDKLEGEVIFTGDGVDVYGKFIKENYTGAVFAPENNRYQRAASVALCAARLADKGEIVSCEELLPNYIRETQAERVRAKKVLDNG